MTTPSLVHPSASGVDHTSKAPPGALLLEVGWEVCHPVGGIYQVIRSKASEMVDAWDKRYLLLGPDMGSKSELEFEPRKARGWMAQVIDDLASRGVRARAGQWLVAGRPRVLLLDPVLPANLFEKVQEELIADHKIDTRGAEALVQQVVAFAHVVREGVTAITEQWGQRRAASTPVIAHFHEWLGGLAIPLLRRAGVPVSVVFTTHATLLGRYLASSDPTILERLDALRHDAEAHRMGIGVQHAIERSCAHGSHVFTTVSKITAEECGGVLGREPDAVTPNGLNVARFSVGHDFQMLHAVFKEQIDQFVMGHFFPSYTFDLGKTLYFFTSGRYEPSNKGFDVCLDACKMLDRTLKQADSDLTVVFFIITRRPTRSLEPNALQTRGVLNELREVCTHITADLGDKLYHWAAAHHRVSLDQLVEEYWSLRLKRTQAAFRTDRLPPVLTHVLESEYDDPVLERIYRLDLVNRADDRVKVVYSPEFITPTNPLWGMEYEQFVRGCHLGVFPSSYEPWGYTPQECLALGVPAMTSDLAGFGRYAAEETPRDSGWAPWILKRRNRSPEQVAHDLANRMLDYCRLDRRGRIQIRNEVERRSWLFDWSRMVDAYRQAHQMALVRAPG